MNILRKGIVLFLTMAILGATGVVWADQKTEKKKYPIPDDGALELTVPTSWKMKIHKPQENMPPAIMFSPATGSDFQVTVMVLSGKKRESGFNRSEKVKSLLQKDGQKLLPRIAEPKIVLQEIKGASHTGYYFFVTDKNPEPGEYRYMTRAGIGVGNLLLNVTILHRVKESVAVGEALSMLRQATQTAK
jgi:hypothetical protein